jgi:hypothetical protein
MQDENPHSREFGFCSLWFSQLINSDVGEKNKQQNTRLALPTKNHPPIKDATHHYSEKPHNPSSTCLHAESIIDYGADSKRYPFPRQRTSSMAYRGRVPAGSPTAIAPPPRIWQAHRSAIVVQ